MAGQVERARLTAFSAWGILGTRNYHLDLDQNASVIVGPNGSGKSTFLSLLYLFVSRQWQRLNEYEFEKLVLSHSNGAIELTKADLLTFESTSPRRTSADRWIGRLVERNAMDLLYKTNLTPKDREFLAETVGVPVSQVQSFRRYVQTEFGFARKGFETDREIQQLNLGQILFLPTYRRIEKDIKSIFPDIEARIRARIEDTYVAPRTGAGFREIAGFGMADIQKLIDDYTVGARESRRLASETASQEYIRDIVSGKIKKYSLSNLRRMDDLAFEDFKSSLDDRLFSEADRRSLQTKMDDLRKRQIGQPNAESRYLGMFVEKLLAAHLTVKERERPLREFVSILSNYLKPDKRASLKGYNIEILSTDDGNFSVPLDKLSSGEKQIVSVFAYLLLSGQKDFILMIDEPELSLSVPWQKRFLPDIISTQSCAHIVSVTHSPFVFDNDLRRSVVDVRRLRVTTNG